MEEATEYLVKLFLERNGYLVSTSKKYHYMQKIKTKNEKTQVQRTLIQLDIVAINPKTDDRIIGEVKSWFGSKGCRKGHFRYFGKDKWEKSPKNDSFKLLHNKEAQQSAFKEVEKEFSRGKHGFRLVFYIGNFYKSHEKEIKKYLSSIKINGNNVSVESFKDIIKFLINDIFENPKGYENDVAIQTLKILNHFKMLQIKK